MYTFKYVYRVHRLSKRGTSLSFQEPFVPAGGLEVTLCELTYYHKWLNISAALGNNGVSDVYTIPDGYYNACELNDKVFQPIGSELCMRQPAAYGCVRKSV